MSFNAATSTSTITTAQTRSLSLRWIIGARDDLVWFIGSVAASYALFALYVGGIVPLIPMVAAWAILIDAPHVFGTFSRTYFDREERQARGRLLWGSLAFFAVGPLMVVAGLGLVFFFLAALWAYYHLVKQHYGFMVLYKKKNADLAPTDNALDRLFILFALSYPFVAFVARDPEASARVPQQLAGGIAYLETILLAATVIIAALWALRQLQRAVEGQPLNVPKYLLLAAVVPMHWLVLLTPMPHKPIAIVAILTIYHNFQYHRLIWFHNRKSSAVASSIISPAAFSSASGIRCRASTSAMRTGRRRNSRKLSPPSSGATPLSTTTSTRKSGAFAAIRQSAKRCGWSRC